MDKVKIKIIEILGYIESLGYGIKDMYFGVDEVKITVINKKDIACNGIMYLVIYKSIDKIEPEDIKLRRL